MIIISELVSIIMSVYNEKIEWIEQSVNSILNQTYKNIEFIIVIDNPNNKEMIELVESYQLHDSRIKIICNEENMGLVKSLNKALAYCKGDYIARMDADDISFLDRIELQIQYLKDKKLDMLFSPMLYINELGQELFTTNINQLEGDKVAKMLSITNISNHPTWFCKHEVYDQLQGYRDVRYCEDYDFSLRAISKGFIIGKMSNITLKYRLRDSGISKSNTYEQYLNSRITAKAFNTMEIENHEKIIGDIERAKNHITPKLQESFSIMNNYFSESVSSLKKGEYFKAIIFALKAISKHKLAINKYVELMKINSIK